MGKLLIQLQVPCVEGQFEVWISDDTVIGDLAPLLSKSVETLSNRRYISSGSEVLCLCDTEEILSLDLTPLQCGVKNGSHIMMF